MLGITLNIFHTIKITINLSTGIPPTNLVRGFNPNIIYKIRQAYKTINN